VKFIGRKRPGETVKLMVDRNGKKKVLKQMPANRVKGGEGYC
jgi:hypothetical protein